MKIISKINLLMAGLASTCTEEFKIANMDYSWLFNNPSTLLWADKIYVTKYMEESLAFTENPRLSKALKLVFDVLDEYGIIKVKDSKSIFNEKVSKEWDDFVINDINNLIDKYPSNIEYDQSLVGQNINVDGTFYCSVNLKSIYVNLRLAQEWNAKSLFGPNETNFLKYKFGMHNNSNNSVIKSFDDIFSMHLPKSVPFVENMLYLNKKSLCSSCNDFSGCESTLLNKIDVSLRKYLELREYDEIYQIKDVIYKIDKKYNGDCPISNSEEIKKEYLEQKHNLDKFMKTKFPKVKLWSNCILFALAVGSVGKYTNSPILNTAELLFPPFVNLVLDKYEHKTNWTGFKIEDDFFNS